MKFKMFAAVAGLALASAAFASRPHEIEHVAPQLFSCTLGTSVDVNVKFNVGIRASSVKVYINGHRIDKKLRITAKGITGRITINDCLVVGDKACGETHLTNVLQVRGREWVAAHRRPNGENVPGCWSPERQFATNFFYVTNPAPAPASYTITGEIGEAVESVKVMAYHMWMGPIIAAN